MKKIFLLVLFTFLAIVSLTKYSNATSIMGSDLTWNCVGQDSFMIRLTLYRDCNGAELGTANINFDCKSTGTSITTKTVIKPAPTDITPTCDESCTRCSDPSCSFPYGIQRYVYQSGIVVLSNAGTCCEVLMSYSSCCRNAAITTGAANKPFYTEAWFNRCLTPCDNSPTFTNPPISIICVGHDFAFCSCVMDTDIDSAGGLIDSITYEWTDPLSNASTPISYNNPYSTEKPLYFWGFPNNDQPFPQGFHLDSNTGDITFRPMKLQQTVMALQAKEYRNGILIGELRRDIQIIVINCPNNHPPVLSGPYYKEVNAGSTIQFSIESNDYDPGDSLLISWNNSIPGAIWTDNNRIVKHPTGTLSWTSGSTITNDSLISFTATVKDDFCPVNGTTTRVYQILVKAPLSIDNVLSGNEIKLYPNPYNKYTNIVYNLNKESNVTILIYNFLGKLVTEIVNTKQQPGTYKYQFSAKTFGYCEGLYLLRFEVDGQAVIRKLLEMN